MENKFNAKELARVAEFISSINNLIHGKFILADVKIAEVLSKIEQSENLFRFVQECLIGFNYDKELRKAEIKNRFNGGVFKLPGEENAATALSFCLLVDFNAKEIDFYEFIKDNFPTLDHKGDYHAFAQVILMPFRDTIARYFGLSKDDNNAVLKDLENRAAKEEIEKAHIMEMQQEELTREEELFLDIEKIERHLLEIIASDLKIKKDQKENLTFLLKSMIYANRYKDFKILNALLFSFEHFAKKVQSIQFIYDELKELVANYYEQKK